MECSMPSLARGPLVLPRGFPRPSEPLSQSQICYRRDQGRFVALPSPHSPQCRLIFKPDSQSCGGSSDTAAASLSPSSDQARRLVSGMPGPVAMHRAGVFLASRGEGHADGVLLAGQHWPFPNPRSTSLDRKHHSTGGPTSSQWRLAPSLPSASDRQRESERGTALRECLMSCCSPLGGDSLCRDYAQDR